MNQPRFLMAVVHREYCENYISFFQRNGSAYTYACLCEGTAKKKTLDLLGLERRDMALVSCVVPDDPRPLMKKMVREFRIDAPNTGIAFTIAEEINTDSREAKDMEYPYALITVIAERGSAESLSWTGADAAGARPTSLEVGSTDTPAVPRSVLLESRVSRVVDDAFLGEADDKGRMPAAGKVALVAVVLASQFIVVLLR